MSVDLLNRSKEPSNKSIQQHTGKNLEKNYKSSKKYRHLWHIVSYDDDDTQKVRPTVVTGVGVGVTTHPKKKTVTTEVTCSVSKFCAYKETQAVAHTNSLNKSRGILGFYSTLRGETPETTTRKGQPKEGTKSQSTSVRPVIFLLRRMHKEVLTVFSLDRTCRWPISATPRWWHFLDFTCVSTHHVVLETSHVKKHILDVCFAADCWSFIGRCVRSWMRSCCGFRKRGAYYFCSFFQFPLLWNSSTVLSDVGNFFVVQFDSIDVHRWSVLRISARPRNWIHCVVFFE